MSKVYRVAERSEVEPVSILCFFGNAVEQLWGQKTFGNKRWS